MFENAERKERVILVVVHTGDERETRDSLGELQALAETADVETVTTVLQNRENPDPGTYIGKGKIEEIAGMLEMLEADAIITDDELTPAQMNNLAEALNCRVYDRTMLILDIFAQRARTSEGKIQVELAQLRYRQQHLVGMRSYLSRLGGGITLTNAGVLEEDALFATLDPTTRLLNLPEGGQILLTDTVGFIRKLPHTLIDAFHSTLEEAALADYIIHVADASSPHLEQQMKVVYQTLHELNADRKKIIISGSGKQS